MRPGASVRRPSASQCPQASTARAAELGALASLGGLRLGLPAALVGVPAVPDGPGVAAGPARRRGAAGMLRARRGWRLVARALTNVRFPPRVTN
ncbi:hypothetical protein GS928_24950 [Rhodococcus hoagii]|nr:hypothetical protein [Prescottella equi]